jgi:hypothetical protein
MVGLLSFVGSWLWALWRGLPVPHIYDEFSYILAADTFTHGRLTNPMHPMWIYFETFTVLQHPTYMSMYPPGQGFFLAIGQMLFGHPIYGVWLSSGLMCSAICWMLYAWAPPRWALIGGLVAVLQFSIFTYWSQSYLGGALAAMGGALVLGALPRIFKFQRVRDAIWLGLGCMVLAYSRPIEGLFVAVPVGCLVLPWKVRWNTLVTGKFIRKVILPAGIILVITILGVSGYNKRITGDAGVFPHFLYDNTYSSVPLFIFQGLRPAPHFNHKLMYLREQNWNKQSYFHKRTWKGFLRIMWTNVFNLSEFYFGYILAVPALLCLPFLFCRRPMLFMGAIIILVCCCSVVFFHAMAHYYSPLTCLAVLLVTIGLRFLGLLTWRGRTVGWTLVILVIVLQLLLNVFLTPYALPSVSLARKIYGRSLDLPPSFSREQLQSILTKRGGKYLVIVKYPPSHIFGWEWVYNNADIDKESVAWARDMENGDKNLLQYFKDRQILYIMVVWDKPWYRYFEKRQ